MEFCEKCGNMLVPDKRGAEILLACRNCGFTKKYTSQSYKVKQEIGEDKRRKLAIVDESEVKEPKRSKEELELMEDYHKAILELMVEEEEQEEREGH
ncbi:MAG: hypothetical protein NZ926_00560 [Candidatus Methanomethylicia archaeon]|nr:hypothetical protein [Candidatus Methanomethylicia archaeon]MCX8168926.1 hypothetical protein [Candidatus Methanomethylicia archaeon]MDW7988658.1 hypothetical protein [Nitrososphaerota archaeon]